MAACPGLGHPVATYAGVTQSPVVLIFNNANTFGALSQRTNANARPGAGCRFARAGARPFPGARPPDPRYSSIQRLVAAESLSRASTHLTPIDGDQQARAINDSTSAWRTRYCCGMSRVELTRRENKPQGDKAMAFDDLPQPIPPDVPKGDPGLLRLISIALRNMRGRERLIDTLFDWANPIASAEYVDDLVLFRLETYPFPNPPSRGNNWFVAKPYDHSYRRKDGTSGPDGATVTIPPGTYTDLSSVPWLGRLFISVSGRHTEASVVHDYCYQDHDGSGLTRFEVDWLFYVGMRMAKVIWIRRIVAYLAVRFFGWIAYYTGRDD